MRHSSQLSRTMAFIALGLLVAAPPAVLAQDPSVPAAAPRSSPPTDGILGATTVVHREGFETAPAWLELGEDEGGLVALDDSWLLLSVEGGPGTWWESYELAEPASVLRVEALVDLDREDGTAAGVACGSALGLPRSFVAGVNNADEWWLGRMIDGRLSVVDRGLVMLPASPSREPVLLALECASAPADGGDHVAISVNGQPVSIETGLGRLDIPVGPYREASLLVGTDEDSGAARFDDMIVQTGEAYVPYQPDRDPDAPSL